MEPQNVRQSDNQNFFLNTDIIPPKEMLYPTQFSRKNLDGLDINCVRGVVI